MQHSDTEPCVASNPRVVLVVPERSRRFKRKDGHQVRTDSPAGHADFNLCFYFWCCGACVLCLPQRISSPLHFFRSWPRRTFLVETFFWTKTSVFSGRSLHVSKWNWIPKFLRLKVHCVQVQISVVRHLSLSHPRLGPNPDPPEK